MTDMKQPLNEKRTRLRLGEIERLIRKNRLIVPAPSRRALLNMCEAGVLETAGNAPTRLGWLVYEDSFWAWVRSIDGSDEV